MENKFSRAVQEDYDLQKKHLYKKKAGRALGYYQLCFDRSLDWDLKVLSELYAAGFPFKVFGAHTNLYISENGYNGLFLDMDGRNSKIRFHGDEKYFSVTSNTSVSEFVNFTMERGYDFAALAGIPGFAGAGVVGNSGWTMLEKERDFGYFVKEILVYDFKTGEERMLFPGDDFFGARDSFIKRQNRHKTRYFVKEIGLKGDFLGEDIVREKYERQMKIRKNALKYGFTEGAAGSLWSNVHLGREIGKSFPEMLRENPDINTNINGARYSDNGNRFFITEENTTDRDVAEFFRHTIQKVKELYQVDLKNEVMILDRDGEVEARDFISAN